MTPSRQHVVTTDPDEVDVELASFIADVQELGGLFRRVAEEIAHAEGRTQPQWYVLSVVSDAPLTVSQAARRLGTTRQAVQRTVNQLLDLSLVTHGDNPDHRTSPLIALTADGRDALNRISQAAALSRRTWFADTAVAQLQVAHAEVKRLRDILRKA